MTALVPGRALAILLFSCVAAAVFAGGCTLPPAARKLGDSDPSANIPAIKSSVSAKNLASTAQLVEELDSDDSAIRFYAIRALRDISGESFDYHYYHDELQRKPALAAWRKWLKDQQDAATRPAAATSN